ncbi:uncharacterized protein N7483_010280 [Penicillium malachiteum]|uniref:uncharacterized protein n=1 Tax=Penicillium malachiteum TaxID=1324776 RepID=UPI00254964A5|nr:uncharacterized protein N7483_010280 [Penicillium malachiteum]KAJ5713099.1 hypothetical protein N7483_010280 [Penicillium malachiteum]
MSINAHPSPNLKHHDHPRLQVTWPLQLSKATEEGHDGHEYITPKQNRKGDAPGMHGRVLVPLADAWLGWAWHW